MPFAVVKVVPAHYCHLIAAVIPAPVQKLLKLCKSESSDDCEVAVTELLHEIGLCPVNRTSEETLAVQPAENQVAAVNNHEVVGEEVSACPKESASSVLNDIWNGETILHVAAASGKSSLIPILLLHGADPAIK